MGSEPQGKVRDRLHDVLLLRIGRGVVRAEIAGVRVGGVRGGVWGSCGRACAGACAACEPSRVQGAVMAACLNVCGLKVKVNVGAWAVCSAVTCGAWRTLVRREPGLGDVAGEGTLELWSLCGWAQIRVEVALRFLWELRSAD